MIPQSKLLPPLSAKDREAFNQLVADYDTGKAQISKFGGDARVARKKELRQKLKTAKGDELAKIGMELQTLDTSFSCARRAAKEQHRTLKFKYVDLFVRLIERVEARADELLQKADAGYAGHFSAFDAQPVGRSPIALHLLAWKKQLELKKSGMVTYYREEAGMPLRPTEILPYAVESNAEDLV